ncbi:hypothetical protein HY546_00805 [archaeon]|nr:hypothetical protein [archaeon]
MAEYADIPPFQREHKRFESLIPILILVIIGIVLLGKTTSTLCGIPGISSLFCGGEQVNLLILGDFTSTSSSRTTVQAPQLETFLNGPIARSDYHIQYVEATPDLIGTTGALLKGFDIVVMAGERAYTRSAKDRIGEYIRGGGKIILIGDAGTTDPDEPALQGWGIIGEMPVELAFSANLDTPITLAHSEQFPVELRLVDIFHEIVKGYGPRFQIAQQSTTNCGTVNLIDVNIASGGSPLAYVRQDTATSKTVRPAVVTRDTGFLGGKVVYFAYDPGCTPNMFLSTIKWLTGKGL